MDMDEENISELDPEVWEIAKSEKVPDHFRHFVQIAKYSSENKYFLKTKFHDHFCEDLKKRIEEQPVDKDSYNVVGVQGIGKSTSAVYHVLTRINRGDKNIHYIDLEFVKEENEAQFKIFKKFANQLNSSDVVIIDHVTLFNQTTVTKMKSLMHSAKKIITIQTGFAASIEGTFHFQFSEECELSEEEFTKIWIDSLEKQRHTMKTTTPEIFAKLLYARCKKDKYILTPRLLQRVRSFMVDDNEVYDEKNKGIDFFVMRYQRSLGKDIAEFKKHLDLEKNEKQCCTEFLLYTKVILNELKQYGNFVVAREHYPPFRIAINIFSCRYGTVNENDVENDERFLKLGLEVGDYYVNVQLLIPALETLWGDAFFFKIADILEYRESQYCDSNVLMQIFFQCGGLRKEIEGNLVGLQRQLKTLILPPMIEKTICELKSSQKNCTLKQCNAVTVAEVEHLNYQQPTLKHLEDVDISSIQQEYKGHNKTVAKLAVSLNREIHQQTYKQPILIYPKVTNLKGLDYIMFCECGTENNESLTPGESPVPKKKGKKIENYAVFLVQVATGETHNGVTIGEAFKIFENIIEDVPVHLMIIVAKKDIYSYTLSGNTFFENVSVINLSHTALIGTLCKDPLLHCLIELIKR